jgi:hypothetical protein
VAAQPPLLLLSLDLSPLSPPGAAMPPSAATPPAAASPSRARFGGLAWQSLSPRPSNPQQTLAHVGPMGAAEQAWPSSPSSLDSPMDIDDDWEGRVPQVDGAAGYIPQVLHMRYSVVQQQQGAVHPAHLQSSETDSVGHLTRQFQDAGCAPTYGTPKRPLPYSVVHRRDKHVPGLEGRAGLVPQIDGQLDGQSDTSRDSQVVSNSESSSGGAGEHVQKRGSPRQGQSTGVSAIPRHEVRRPRDQRVMQGAGTLGALDLRSQGSGGGGEEFPRPGREREDTSLGDPVPQGSGATGRVPVGERAGSGQGLGVRARQLKRTRPTSGHRSGSQVMNEG